MENKIEFKHKKWTVCLVRLLTTKINLKWQKINER